MPRNIPNPYFVLALWFNVDGIFKRYIFEIRANQRAPTHELIRDSNGASRLQSNSDGINDSSRSIKLLFGSRKSFSGISICTRIVASYQVIMDIMLGRTRIWFITCGCGQYMVWTPKARKIAGNTQLPSELCRGRIPSPLFCQYEGRISPD